MNANTKENTTGDSTIGKLKENVITILDTCSSSINALDIHIQYTR